ncbi:MAG: methyltransferase domain-containing protein [Verrucomicrobiales bacterium]
MDWEQRYLASDTPWDLGQAAPPLLELAREKPALFRPHRRLLVPGCGLGHDARFLASLAPEVTAVDISPEALAQARALDPERSADWQEGDFLARDEPHEQPYDLLWEHTCFCAIPPERRGDYVASAHHHLKPGGVLLGLFFLDPPNAFEDGPPFGVNREELRELFGRFFILEWENPAPPSAPERKGRESLMLWRRLGACWD